MTTTKTYVFSSYTVKPKLVVDKETKPVLIADDIATIGEKVITQLYEEVVGKDSSSGSGTEYLFNFFPLTKNTVKSGTSTTQYCVLAGMVGKIEDKNVKEMYFAAFEYQNKTDVETQTIIKGVNLYKVATVPNATQKVKDDYLVVEVNDKTILGYAKMNSGAETFIVPTRSSLLEGIHQDIFGSDFAGPIAISKTSSDSLPFGYKWFSKKTGQ